MGPALVELHVQLAANVAAVVVSLFDADALATLPASLTPLQQLAGEHFVHRALLRQMNYLGEVGAHLQDSDYNVAWGLFHLRWNNKELPRGFGLRLRSVTMYLPQPVTATVKCPPLSELPTLVPTYFPESAGDSSSFLLARWRHELTISVTQKFGQWYMSLAVTEPHLSAILDKSNLHWEVIQQGYIPSLRLTMTTRVPCAGTPRSAATRFSALAPQVAKTLAELGWTADAIAQMSRETHHPSITELLLSLRDDESGLCVRAHFSLPLTR